VVGAVLRPIPDWPVLELLPPGKEQGGTLILSDIHLGIDGTANSPRSTGPASPAAMSWSLVELARSRSARGFLIAGDAKHPIVGVPRDLRPIVFDFFSTLLAAGFRVEHVPGNHDVGLAEHLPREVVLHPAAGIVRHGVGVFHGHRWPSDAVLGARTIVCGHLHPAYRFAPTPEQAVSKQRCWVRVEFPPPPPARGRRRRKRAPITARELIVLPAFQPMCANEALNRLRPSRGRTFLVKRFLSKGTSRAYLLDGTDVGRIAT
jgi:metallophosphoesterase superfamily enzyme